MPISMDSLALVFIVVSVNGSYAIAGGLSAAASVVMSIATPAWSRVADRIGQSAMLIRVVPIKIAGLCLFTFLVLNQTPTWTWFAAIIFAESFSVNTGGLVRRRWLHILSPDKSTTAEDESDRHIVNTAYSFEVNCTSCRHHCRHSVYGSWSPTFCDAKINRATCNTKKNC